MIRVEKFLPFSQITRYGLVGVLSNVTAYMVYLLLTYLGLDPKLTVSIIYPFAATLSYAGHARYSFTYAGSHKKGIVRFVLAHICGYLLNVTLLYIFVDILGFRHELVQLCNMFVVSGFLFLMLKYFAFRKIIDRQ